MRRPQREGLPPVEEGEKETFGARACDGRFEVFIRESLWHCNWFDTYEEAEKRADELNQAVSAVRAALKDESI